MPVQPPKGHRRTNGGAAADSGAHGAIPQRGEDAGCRCLPGQVRLSWVRGLDGAKPQDRQMVSPRPTFEEISANDQGSHHSVDGQDTDSHAHGLAGQRAQRSSAWLGRLLPCAELQCSLSPGTLASGGAPANPSAQAAQDPKSESRVYSVCQRRSLR